jgi:predicted TIM-barrel fold metal-dependent hydrolase
VTACLRNTSICSRRQFCGSIAAGAAALSTGRFLKAQEASAADSYVDVHLHLGQPWNERGELTAEMLLRWMDAHRIEQGVVLPLISPESWFYPITSQWVLQQTAPFRDRLIPFCAVDPRSVNLGGYSGFIDILRRYIDAGARGMGEHKWGGAINDPRNVELMQACGEVRLPVLFHLDNIRNTDAPGLPGLEELLRQAPETVLIGHGPGWWASISGQCTAADLGGYPRGPVQPGGAIDRLMERYPNLYGDLSAGSGNNALTRDPDFTRSFVDRRQDRLMFGTDFLATGQEVPQFETLASLEVRQPIRDKILRQNARRILSMDQVSPPEANHRQQESR